MISYEVNVLCDGASPAAVDYCSEMVGTEPGDPPTVPELAAFARREGWTVTGDEPFATAEKDPALLTFRCPACAQKAAALATAKQRTAKLAQARKPRQS